MNKAVLLILTGTLGLLTQSCSFFSDFADARKELEENTAKPVPTQVDTSQQANIQETGEEFADLEEEEVEPTQEIAGLIPATNPDARVRSSVRGRNDPFSIVTLNPRIEIEQQEVKQPAKNKNDRISTEDRRSSRDSESNLDLPEPEIIAEPTLAQEVVISGLYEANGTIKLIVQAPEENTSRYVEVGQYLSNGQVLVKSIDKDHFPYPLVILEQSGIEVAKTIGGDLSENEGLASLPTSTPNKDWLSSNSLNANLDN